jgi:hypothetical protein
MAPARKSIDDEELVSYILAGLDAEYNYVVSVAVARVEPITVSELYGQLLSFESRQFLLQGLGSTPSISAATRGRCGFSRGNSHIRFGGRTRGGNTSRPLYNNNNNCGNVKHQICQACEKEGHIDVQCWYMFDESYNSEEKISVAAIHAYGVDTNWYTDTGATDHITGELEKLDVRAKYNRNELVHMASGSGMNITHIGHSVISTPEHNIILRNIHHVPETTKKLLSVHRFTTDNHASLE